MITIDLTMPLHIINMLLLIVIMNVVLYRPIRSILLEREKKLSGLSKDIETFEKNSNLRLEEFNRKLAEARGKGKAEFETVKGVAQSESGDKLAAIRKEAEAEKAEQLGKIQGQFAAARQVLAGEMGSFAGEMANKILGRTV
ncbi:MAG: ATP synthase F0 subunit B [Desulfobacteraceae bacterium]|nr:ATP synthase F0 subunit B [Desulfobacteraceae bacterium]